MAKFPSRKTLKSWSINLLLLLLVYYAVQAYQGRNALQSGPAPQIEAVDLKGKMIDLNDYRGRPALIYFWATWCNVCGLTRGAIDAIAEEHGVITIASQSGAKSDVLAYTEQYHFQPVVINDENGELSRRYGVRAFPTMFILDGQGNIHDVEIGLSSEWGLRFRLWWAGM